jgi:hypothetical protein
MNENDRLISHQFRGNSDSGAFLVCCPVPLLDTPGDRALLLTNTLIVELQHRHYLVPSEHDHLIGLLPLRHSNVSF